MLFLATIFSVILYVVLSQEQKTVIAVTPQQILEFRKNAATCGQQYNVDPANLRKMLDWTIPDDDAHKKFLYCMCTKSGFIQEDGHYIIERMLDLETVNGTKEELKSNLEECNKITLDNEFDTIYEMGTCIHRYHITIARTNTAA